MVDRDYDNIKIEREDAVTFLILNRPDKRNAMSPALHYEMEDALTRLANDEHTKVLVLGGAGDAWSSPGPGGPGKCCCTTRCAAPTTG